MFHVDNKYRWRDHPARPSHDGMGNNGFFVIPHHRITNYEYRIMASDGMGWEHASVSVGKIGEKQHRCPTWEEMCWIKDFFWDEDDCVVQYHPSKSEYVNMHPFVLHLWRPTEQKMPIPFKEMVGINI